jgi:hypothetical protein
MSTNRTLTRVQLNERDELVLRLIENDIQDIQNGETGVEWLKTVLKNGFKGYDSFSMTQLKKEFDGRCLPE